MGENRIRWMWCDIGDSQRFAKSEFQTFEPNSEIGAVNERTIELLQTSSAALLVVLVFWSLDHLL